MDQSSSPQFSGDAEDCSSSESGWTMYLASPMHGGSSNDDDNDDDGEVYGGSGTIGGRSSGDGEGKEEDDSMVSDASSGTPCKLWHDGMRHVKHGNVCGDVGVLEENRQCSSRYSRRIHKVERTEEKGVSSKPSKKEDNGDSISIRGSSKMRRVKSNEK